MAYPEDIEPELRNMSRELCRIVWHHERLNDLGPIHTRTARIALSSTPRLFAIILKVALRNGMISLSGDEHIRVRVLGESSTAKARSSMSEVTKSPASKKSKQLTLDRITHARAKTMMF